MGCKKRQQREKRRGGAALASLGGSCSLPPLPQSHYSITHSAGARSHLTVPIFDLFTAFTGADSHRVLLVPHRSFLSVK